MGSARIKAARKKLVKLTPGLVFTPVEKHLSVLPYLLFCIEKSVRVCVCVRECECVYVCMSKEKKQINVSVSEIF